MAQKAWKTGIHISAKHYVGFNETKQNTLCEITFTRYDIDNGLVVEYSMQLCE